MGRILFSGWVGLTLIGCVEMNNQERDCYAATEGVSNKYDACMKASRDAQYKAHRIIVKDFMSKT